MTGSSNRSPRRRHGAGSGSGRARLTVRAWIATTYGPVLVALPRAAVLVALPLALALALVPAARDADGAALSQDLLAYPLLLVAGAVLSNCRRVADDAAIGWLAAGVTLLAAQGVGLAAIRLARPETASEHDGWSTGIDLSVQALLLLLAALAARDLRSADRLVIDPFMVGMAGAIVIVAARVIVLALPPAGGDAAAVRVLAALTLTAQVGTSAFLLRATCFPRWFRTAVAGAVILLGLSHFITAAGAVGELGAVGSGLAVATGLLGTSLVLASSFTLFEVLLRRLGSTVVGLNHRVDHLEADARVDQEHRHEVGSTFAGIANGIHLLRSLTLLPEDRRRDLETMIESEAARLQRLMDPGPPIVSEDRDIDAVLHPLVAAHRTRGRVVHWQPSGLQVRCRPDDVAQVVNILLENAVRHAGTAVTLTVGRVGASIELRVSDDGPGVDPAVVETIFRRGQRGTLSTGQGLGLHIAHRLMSEQGGGLRLVQDATVPGATFVVSLPRPSAVRTSADGRQPAVP